MKSFLERLLYAYCSPYRWYRKRIGGTWYQVIEKDVSGIAAPSDFWTQDPGELEVLKTEVY
jgi:multimeric flavodoxin WrbA